MNILSPSLLSIDFNHIERNAKVLDDAGVKWFHLDVMDGTFVRNISFGPPVIKCIRKITDSFFDVHLMINEPIRYIDAFADAGADMLTVHYEACKNLQETIDAVKAAGLKVGVAVNPETPVHWLDYYINQVDMVLIMSVNPGFGRTEVYADCAHEAAGSQGTCRGKKSGTSDRGRWWYHS